MRIRQTHHPLRYACLALLAAAASCGSEKPYDWKNREIPWSYGPINGTATSEHMSGTGSKGAGAIAEGWNCRLSDGTHLTVKPYHLASSHALFGKAKLILSMFDETGKKLGTVQSAAITAQNATFTFEISEALAQPTHELVIWYSEL